MRWLMLSILAAIIMTAPYQRGLFFNNDMYIYEIIIMICFLVWGISTLWAKDDANTIKFLPLFAIPLFYSLEFFFAESMKYNFDNLLRWLTYCAFFVLLVWTRSHSIINRWASYLFLLSGALLSIFSFLGSIGWIQYQDIMLDNRLTGPFQYANTFSAVMGAYLLYSLFTLIKGQQDKLTIVLCSFPLTFYVVDFILAYSRGAFLVLPLVWFAGLLFLQFKEQLKLLAYTAYVFLVSGLIYLLSDHIASWFKFITLLIAASLMVLICIWGGGNKARVLLSKWNNQVFLLRYGRAVVVAAVVCLFVLLIVDIAKHGFVYNMLPDTMQNRLSDINLKTSSVVGRASMYRDAMNISLDHPFGIGGGGWKILYSSYQSTPYLSNEIHNGYLDILLSIGWFGFLAFVSIFTWLGVIIFRGRREAASKSFSVRPFPTLLALSVLAIHAILDFDFSYGVYWFLALWLLASLIPVNYVDLTETTRKTNKKKVQKIKLTPQIGIRIAVLFFVLIGLIYAIRFYFAKEAINLAKGNITVDTFESAFSKDPYNINLGINLAEVYRQIYISTQDKKWKEQIDILAEKMERLEPRNPSLYYQLSSLNGQLGDGEKAISYIDKAINYEKFNVKLYEYSIDLKRQIASQYIEEGKAEQGEKLFESAVNDYNNYKEWYQKVSDKQVPDMRNIHLSRNANLAAAKSYLGLNRPDEAFAIVNRYNPVVDEGVLDEVKGTLLSSSFDFITLDEVLSQSREHIVIITLRDEATAKLPTSFKESMTTMGSAINGLKYRGSFAAVVADRRVLAEQINNDGEVQLTPSNASEAEQLLKQPFSIKSAGLFFGNYSSINVNGKEYSPNKRGLNFAIFDRNMNFLYSMNIDTHESDIKVFRL